MSESAQVLTQSAAEVVRAAPVSQSPNGVCFALAGELPLDGSELERIVAAVPVSVAASLARKAFYFVPMVVERANEVCIATRYDVELSEHAVCHRNVRLGDSECVFISTRLTDDKFSIAFEFFINVAHAFVERAGVPESFSELCWRQVGDKVRGETGLDAWELRKLATGSSADAGRARNDYSAAAFADAVAIYMLGTFMDVDYYDLRERDYPLLAPPALAERLRAVAELFPPNPGFEFNVYYRRVPR